RGVCAGGEGGGAGVGVVSASSAPPPPPPHAARVTLTSHTLVLPHTPAIAPPFRAPLGLTQGVERALRPVCSFRSYHSARDRQGFGYDFMRETIFRRPIRGRGRMPVGGPFTQTSPSTAPRRRRSSRAPRPEAG